MAAPGARGDRRRWHSVRAQLARDNVQVPRHDLVSAQVDAEHVPRVEIGEDLVGVGPFLTVWVGSGAVPRVLESVGHRADRAVGQDLVDREVALPVVGSQEVPSRRMHAEVSREGAVGRSSVDEGEVSVRLVDGIGAHASEGDVVAGGAVLVGGVEVRQRWIERQERGVVGRHHLDGH